MILIDYNNATVNQGLAQPSLPENPISIFWNVYLWEDFGGWPPMNGRMACLTGSGFFGGSTGTARDSSICLLKRKLSKRLRMFMKLDAEIIVDLGGSKE